MSFFYILYIKYVYCKNCVSIFCIFCIFSLPPKLSGGTRCIRPGLYARGATAALKANRQIQIKGICFFEAAQETANQETAPRLTPNPEIRNILCLVMIFDTF